MWVAEATQPLRVLHVAHKGQPMYGSIFMCSLDWRVVSAPDTSTPVSSICPSLPLDVATHTGVTQVGLHERSAREKISHSMNSTSEAHIMNDEATRKYFQVCVCDCGCVC